MEADPRPTRGLWPKNPVIYQIYPRSFQDTSETGEGDLRGITTRLEHVASLGVDSVWLSPFFASPMCDGGYDVADQTAVDPRFGTLDDFDALVARAHALGLRVMIDQVFNHTSDQHPWFQKSLRREPGFEDMYVWQDPRPDGSAPSNWIAFFGGAAWRWHPQRAQYCLHQFLPCQPSLNHRNPKVHDALREITEFWLARGVDGFRYDAVTSFFYDPEFRDNPPAGDTQARIPGPANNPFTMQRHDNDMLPNDCAAFARDIRDWAGPDQYLIGEINEGPKSIEVLRKFTGPDRLDAGYVVDLAERGVSGTVLSDMIARLGAPGPLAWWLSSHDQARHVSRDGDGSARDARLFAALTLALPGPVLLFQGEELGMTQSDLPFEALHDPFDRTYWPDPPGRDGARTPMVWEDDAPNYGFTSAAPWLPMICPPDGPADRQLSNEGSVLQFYRTALRKRGDLNLADGRIEVLLAEDRMFIARIVSVSDTVVLAVNLTDGPQDVPYAGTLRPALQSAEQPVSDQIAPRSAIWYHA
ncbi:alpha-amylase family glycosyl hydrolase [Tateyamaria pelophila]|uniref:alpha-amylase family glycosyl hydrolase n=1 Tax=Tateyamaria pelophila TaxID=328415 RepID=UPI001CC0A3F2|nr:alpha-amylase family glycosyl hydrolase [Tateyamaria pelophila]